MDMINFFNSDPIAANICRDILKVYTTLAHNGFITGTWGNIGVRYENYYILTPSRVSLDEMTEYDMVVLDSDGSVVHGHRVPTSEREIHRLIMNGRVDINATIHTHSPYAIAASATGLCIPPLFEEMTQLLGGKIPCTSRYVPAGSHMELAETTTDALGEYNAVLLRNHGAFCCGRDINEAMVTCQVVEKAAQVYLTLEGKTDFNEIPSDYAVSERNRFLTRYGKE